jgi:hypothetical protein
MPRPLPDDHLPVIITGIPSGQVGERSQLTIVRDAFSYPA